MKKRKSKKSKKRLPKNLNVEPDPERYAYYFEFSDALRSNFFGTSSDPIQRPSFGSRSDPDPIFYRWN